MPSIICFFFFSSRRRHTRLTCDWSSDVCSSDLAVLKGCPEWEAIDNDGDGKPDSDKIGYGMSRRLRTPESRTRYHYPGPDPAIPVASPTGINGPITTDKSNHPSVTVYLAPWWKMTQ